MQNTSEKFYKKLLGENGERRAERYLVSLNYKIIAKNYRTKTGEIDIIADDGGEIVFVEVKTRTSTVYGRPGDAVGRDKQRKYDLTSQTFLSEKNLLDVDYRFDVIEILSGEINHIKNAF